LIFIPRVAIDRAVCYVFGRCANEMMLEVTVRRLSADPAAGSTWAEVRQLCCRTGDNGDPIAPERWDFFARLWIEPYEKLLPQWTYVAEVEGALAGYLTGCPDSARFARAKFWRHTLPLLAAMAAGRYRRVPGTHQFARQALGLTSGVECRFSRSVQEAIAVAYPAHLHINVDAGYRRLGIGRRLIEEYWADLRAARIPGVHLFCGRDPVEFYRRLGFHELGRVETGRISVFALGIRW
jgi:ribosomal protein S18 acetylase RimI-like enzyme